MNILSNIFSPEGSGINQAQQNTTQTLQLPGTITATTGNGIFTIPSNIYTTQTITSVTPQLSQDRPKLDVATGNGYYRFGRTIIFNLDEIKRFFVNNFGSLQMTLDDGQTVDIQNLTYHSEQHQIELLTEVTEFYLRQKSNNVVKTKFDKLLGE